MVIDFPRKKEVMRLRRGRKADEKRLEVVCMERLIWSGGGDVLVSFDFVAISELACVSLVSESRNGFWSAA